MSSNLLNNLSDEKRSKKVGFIYEIWSRKVILKFEVI